MSVAIRTATRIQDQDDFGSTPGAGNDGYALTWDNGAGEFVLAAAGGVTDHGALTGLSDDDHSQYLLATGARVGATSQAQVFRLADAATNTVSGVVTVGHNTSASAAAGFGGGLAFNLQSSTTANQSAAAINAVWTDATHATRTSALQFQTLNSAGALATAMTIAGAGNVGIGTTAPVGKLDVAYDISVGSPSLSIGANNAGGTSARTNLVDKVGSIGFVHRMNAEETVCIVLGVSSSTANALVFGGGSSRLNAATTISFYTAATTTTTMGSMRMFIDSAGLVGINDATPGERLDVNGNINTTGVLKIDDVQVVSNRVIDARCTDTANSGDATTDGLIDALRDAMITHGLIAAA